MAAVERPREATLAVLLMAVTGAVGLGLGAYLIGWGGDLLGGTFLLTLGATYAYAARGLHRGESWGWGAGMFAGGFCFLFGIFLLPLTGILLALAAVVMVLLYRARVYYGMVRYDPAEDERKKAELESARTQNPDGIHCPHCGGTRLWISSDDSAFCLDCRIGIISIRRAG